jgi:MFS family permease
MFVTGLLAGLLIRKEPADVGQVPFRLKESGKKKKVSEEWEGFTVREAFQKPWFYLAAIGFFFVGFAIQSMSNIAKPYIYDLGYNKNFVITVFSIHSLVLLTAKALTGIGNDTIGLRKTYAVLTAASVVAFLALFFLPVPGTGAFGEILFPWIYSVFSSLGLPLESVIISLFTAYLFGKKDYAHVLGYLSAATTLGCAVGAPVVNIFYDLQGTYKWVVLILAVMTFLTAVLHETIMAYVNRKYREPALMEGRGAE